MILIRQRRAIFDVIYGKTARLFEAATQLAAVINNADPKIEESDAPLWHALRHSFPVDR